MPQIRETSTGFRSKILDAYVSRTEKLDELIARMYVHGMSTRDIEATFADVLSGTGVSKSVVSRVTQCLSDDFEVFRKRDLSSEELLYLELDGTFLRYHQGAEKKEPILVATGYRIDGTRVLLHIGVGNGESYANWKGFLQEMVARGLREPLLIVTDGNPGVLKAIEEVFPQSLKQRCQKHRLENILGKAPKEIHDELKAALLHGPEQIADLPVPVAESPGAVRIGHPERSHLVEYLAPNSVFNSLPRQRSSPHLRPDDRLVTIDRVLHHASLGVA